MKEKVVTDYNSGMGFVDKNDAIISQHDMVRKCQKWATKMAFHLIEEALLNAHILYGMSPEPILTYTNFKLVYIENVLSPLPESEVRPQRYEGQHYLEKVPSTKPTETSRMKRCVHCYKNGLNKRSRYQCDIPKLQDFVYHLVSRNTSKCKII